MTTYHAQEYAEILKSKSNSKKPTLSMEVSGLELTTEVQVMSEKDVIDTPGKKLFFLLVPHSQSSLAFLTQVFGILCYKVCTILCSNGMPSLNYNGRE
jgi:hypothetical protein